MGEWIPLGRTRLTHLCKWRTAELPRNEERQWPHCRSPLALFPFLAWRSVACLLPPASSALPQCPLLAGTPCLKPTSTSAAERQRCVLSAGTGRRYRLLLLLSLLHRGPNIIFMQIAVAVATAPKRRSLPRRLPVDGR